MNAKGPSTLRAYSEGAQEQRSPSRCLSKNTTLPVCQDADCISRDTQLRKWPQLSGRDE